MAEPDASLPGVDSLFAGLAGPAGPAAAASSAPSSGRASPSLGGVSVTVAAPIGAVLEAQLEQPAEGQPDGSGSAADLQGLETARTVRSAWTS